MVRYAAMMDRLYLVEFEATQAGAPTNREQQIRQLEKLIIPTIESLEKDGKVRTGASPQARFPVPLLLKPSQKTRYMNWFARFLPRVLCSGR